MQFSTNKFCCCITNPLQVIWINAANTSLGSAGADENSDTTEKNETRNNTRAEGNTGVRSASVRATASQPRTRCQTDGEPAASGSDDVHGEGEGGKALRLQKTPTAVFGVFKQKCCSAGERAGDTPRAALPWSMEKD